MIRICYIPRETFINNKTKDLLKKFLDLKNIVKTYMKLCFVFIADVEEEEDQHSMYDIYIFPKH